MLKEIRRGEGLQQRILLAVFIVLHSLAVILSFAAISISSRIVRTIASIKAKRSTIESRLISSMNLLLRFPNHLNYETHSTGVNLTFQTLLVFVKNAKHAPPLLGPPIFAV